MVLLDSMVATSSPDYASPQIDHTEPTASQESDPPTVISQPPPDAQSESSLSSEPAIMQTFEHSGEATMSTLSSENMETELLLEREVEKIENAFEPMQTEDLVLLDECQRLRSSSYEDIYKETTFEPEKDESHILEDQTDVGDRFDTKHVETHLEPRLDGKTSSFENVYEETIKEAASVEEKDVDEIEVGRIELEHDLQLPEKGAIDLVRETEIKSPESYTTESQDGKTEVADQVVHATTMDDVNEPESITESSAMDEEPSSVKEQHLESTTSDDRREAELEQAEEYDSFDMGDMDDQPPKPVTAEDTLLDLTSADKSGEQPHLSPIQIQKYPSPIDVTLESGLDQVGQEETEPMSTFIEADHDSLERSQSYEGEPEHDLLEPERQRHYSSPDDVLQRENLEDLMAPTQEGKGTSIPLSFTSALFGSAASVATKYSVD